MIEMICILNGQYDGRFKRTIVTLDLSVSLRKFIVSEFMYSLGYRLIACTYTLDTMNLYKIIFNVIAIGLQK